MRKKMWIGSVIASLIILVMVFSSLGMAQQKGGKEETFQWPRMLRIGTHGAATTGYAIANGWGPMLGQEKGITVRVVPEDSEIVRTQRLINNELDIIVKSIGDSSVTFMGEEGQITMEPMPHSIIWHSIDAPFAVMVAGDSPYKTIYDLKQKGVRMARAVGSPSLDRTAREALPAFLGWTPEEALENWVFVPAGGLAENARTVTDGRADASLTTPVAGFAYELEGHPRGTRYLSMPLSDQEGWDRFMQKRPAAIPMTVDYGVPSGLGVETFCTNVLWHVRMDENPEFVYQMAKWFHENTEKIKEIHSLANRMEIKYFRSFLNHNGWPVHPRAVRYLREIGQWTDQDDEWNKEAHDLLVRWSAARRAALAEARAKGVRLHWENQELIDIMKKHTQGLPVFSARF